MYVMTQQLQLHHDPAYGPETARKPEFCQCDHTDDIIFTFGLPLIDQKLTFDVKFTEDEKKLSREWMKYIVNFANNGCGICILFLLCVYPATGQRQTLN